MQNNTSSSAPRKFKVSLGTQDSIGLKDIAKKLGISESDVMRKGLQLMALYVETQEAENGQFLIRRGDREQETRIVL
ncbi:MAG: hypothetical protein AAFP09_01035 [Cyanobacteria bacterium J06607_10]